MSAQVDLVTSYIQKIVPVILLVTGTVGNTLSLIVLTRQKKKNSTTVYLITLSIVDLTVLLAGLSREIVGGYFELDLRDTSAIVCKLHKYIVYFSTHCSSWLIVLVTVERVVSVWQPTAVRTRCNARTAIVSIVSVILTLALINSHLLYGYSLIFETSLNITTCGEISGSYLQFVETVWYWTDLALLFLVPFIIIMTGNVLIAIKLKRSKDFRRQMGASISRQTTDSVTRLLVTINIVFMVCMSPIFILIIGQKSWWTNEPTGLQLSVRQLFFVIARLINYVNYCVNFVFYLACGRKFREDLKTICCGSKERNYSVRSTQVTSLSQSTPSHSHSHCHVSTVTHSNTERTNPQCLTLVD